MGKALRQCFVAWLIPLGLSFVSNALIAGSTSKLGASAVGPWMMAAIALQLVFFAAASVRLWRQLGAIEKSATRLGLFAVHSAVQLGLAATMAFATLVMFNR
ncbi:MAG: hypothetical protein JNJ46_19615 [Myxococcales bacterium]|nr:hypothetical protein [Myxococcales bacterium]